MRAALAPAKINLSLRVFSPESDGYHPLDSLVLAVDWFDHVRLDVADADGLAVDGEPAPAGDDNLVWKAVRHLRESTESRDPLTIELSKRIPSGAGLGGGSSDAAAAIVAACDLLGVASPEPASLFSIGADVPFFMTGGLGRMTGRGETVESLGTADGFAVAIVVPAVELATPSVYRRWDALGEPLGPAISDRAVPPPLRSHGPLQNDLWPAALDLAPDLGEWRSELAGTWGTDVVMTGSGSGLFAFFADLDEATEAIGAVALPARALRAAAPVSHGAIIDRRYTAERP